MSFGCFPSPRCGLLPSLVPWSILKAIYHVECKRTKDFVCHSRLAFPNIFSSLFTLITKPCISPGCVLGCWAILPRLLAVPCWPEGFKHSQRSCVSSKTGCFQKKKKIFSFNLYTLAALAVAAAIVRYKMAIDHRGRGGEVRRWGWGMVRKTWRSSDLQNSRAVDAALGCWWLNGGGRERNVVPPICWDFSLLTKIKCCSLEVWMGIMGRRLKLVNRFSPKWESQKNPLLLTSLANQWGQCILIERSKNFRLKKGFSPPSKTSPAGISCKL